MIPTINAYFKGNQQELKVEDVQDLNSNTFSPKIGSENSETLEQAENFQKMLDEPKNAGI